MRIACRRVSSRKRSQISRARAAESPKGTSTPRPVGQQLLGVPVGRRDDGLAATERVGQRARGDLRGVQVGRDVDVGHADEFEQLVDLDEPVVEAHVLLDAQALGQPLQADPVPFPLLADRLGCVAPSTM